MKMSEAESQLWSPRRYKSLLALETVVICVLTGAVIYFATKAISTDKKLSDCRNDLKEHQLYSPSVACGDGHGGLNPSNCVPTGVDCRSGGTCEMVAERAMCSLYVRNTSISGYTCECVPTEVKLCYAPDPTDASRLRIGYQRCDMTGAAVSSWGACTLIPGL